MPDFEIRYFHADGRLAMVHVSNHDSEQEAVEHARRNQKDHARFEVRSGNGSPITQR